MEAKIWNIEMNKEETSDRDKTTSFKNASGPICSDELLAYDFSINSVIPFLSQWLIGLDGWLWLIQIETMLESAGFFLFYFSFSRWKEPTFVYYHSTTLPSLQTCCRQVSKIQKRSDELPEPRYSRWAALYDRSVIGLENSQSVSEFASGCK